MEEKSTSHDTELRDCFMIKLKESQSKRLIPSSAFLGALNAQTSFVTNFPVFAPSNSNIQPGISYQPLSRSHRSP